MKKTLALMLLAGACAFMFSDEAKADVSTITEVSYYEPTNSIFAWAEITYDYDTWVYYCLDDWGDIRKDDVSLTMFWGGTCEHTGTYYSEFFPYDPDADYSIEVYPQLIPRFNYNYPMGGYEDYYNYTQWTNENTVYAPYYFGFTGPGPNVQTSLSSILLGTVFSIFTQGGTSGPPHHLRVIHDQDVVRFDLCGQLQKLIDFQVVDLSNRFAGKVPIAEKPVNVTDSCSSSTVNLSTTCSNSDVGTFGNFRDGIKTGCPHTGPSVCGFDFFNRWRWCRQSSPYTPSDPVDLAWMYYDATRTVIKVDNEADIQDLTYKYP